SSNPWSEAPRYVRQNAFVEPYDPFDHINSPRSDESSTSSSSPRSSNFTSSVEDVDISNIENEFFQHSGQRQPLRVLYDRRFPLPENTADYDEPLPSPTTSTSLINTTSVDTGFTTTTRTTAVSQSYTWSGKRRALGIMKKGSLLFLISFYLIRFLFFFLSFIDRPRSGLRTGLVVVLFAFTAYQFFPYCVELQTLPTELLCTEDPDAPTYVWIPVFQWSSCRYDWTALLFVTIIVALCCVVLKGRP
ncbi:hypothetical protein BCR42DRAFT_425167, partial [Absidia repens]